MRGLLIKDLKSLALQSRVLLVLIVFYTAFFFLTDSSEGGASMIGAFVAMMGVLLPVTAISYDEKARWDHYALTMPISRSMLVWSKYLLAFIIALAGGLLVLTLMLLGQGDEPMECLFTAWALFGVNLLLAALIYPLFFKLGAEKARYAMMAIFFIPTIGILVLSRTGVRLPALSPDSGKVFENALLSLPLAAGALFLLSGLLSCRIYSKKEF